jgi:cobalt/nickel transport system permease protein
MHVSDGLLPTTVCAGGYVVAAGVTAVSLRWIHDRDVPRIALMTSAFFAVSLIHLRIGAASVHLLLHGLVGVVVGRAAMLPIVVGLVLQALLFGHGGITTIGVNAVMLGLPALLAGCVVRSSLVGLGDSPRFGATPPRTPRPVLGGFAAGSGAVLLSLLMFLGVGLTADHVFFRAIGLLVIAHLPLAVIEGLITASAVAFLAKVKPEIFHASYAVCVRAPGDVDERSHRAGP